MTKIDAELDAYDEELCSFISEVRKDISNTLIDYQGISVLMHVPLPNLGGDTCPNGFMVDVGYFSDDINKYQLAGQNAVSGESGHAFKNAKFKDNLYVTAREITEGTVQEFETFNEGLENLVAALVTHDKERHPDVAGEWKSTHSPPLGRHIHHLPVSPYRPDVRGCHSNPILGIVYTLSVDEKVSSAMYTNLARSAMNVGDLIVKKLARTFFE
ncbi:MAG: hypothetical protein AB2705_21665, partial [Candidatus Thiodiazotropha sp.]